MQSKLYEKQIMLGSFIEFENFDIVTEQWLVP